MKRTACGGCRFAQWTMVSPGDLANKAGRCRHPIVKDAIDQWNALPAAMRGQLRGAVAPVDYVALELDDNTFHLAACDHREGHSDARR